MNKSSRTKKLFYYIGRTDEKLITKKEFAISLKRTVLERINHGFIRTYKPIIDDAPYRIFDSMYEYNAWCNRELPKWLGYGKTK